MPQPDPFDMTEQPVVTPSSPQADPSPRCYHIVDTARIQVANPNDVLAGLIRCTTNTDGRFGMQEGDFEVELAGGVTVDLLVPCSRCGKTGEVRTIRLTVDNPSYVCPHVPEVRWRT